MGDWAVLTKNPSTPAKVVWYPPLEIGISMQVFDLIGAPPYVTVIVDQKRHLIGIKAAQEGDPHARAVKAPSEKRKRWRSIAASSIDTLLGTPQGQKIRFAVKPKGDILVCKPLDLLASAQERLEYLPDFVE